MERLVEPELLDQLPVTDLRAIRSRRDLRLVNSWMRNGEHLRRAITTFQAPPRRILEIGAGDGTLMLKVARELAPLWRHPVQLWLLDMRPVLAGPTLQAFDALGWTVHVVPQDLRDWIRRPEPAATDLIIANLFLHHFSNDALRELFTAFAGITAAFLSCDPRRWRPASWATRMLWILGCNRVTRHDAITSVRAGFRGQELTALWPPSSPFELREYPAGYASHVFMAWRREKQPR